MHRTVFRILCLLAIVPVVSLSSARELFSLGALGALLLILRVVVARERFVSLVVAIWGASIFVLPWVGSHLLLAVSLMVCFVVAPGREKGLPLLWAAPFLAYVGGSAAAEIFSALGFLRQVRLDDLARVRDALHSLFDVQAPTWKMVARTLVFALSVECFATNVELRRPWMRGAQIGALIAALYAIVQWCGLIPVSLQNQSEFWTSIHRVSGLATDPNALGVTLALAVWCLFCMYPRHQRISTRDLLWLLVLVIAGLVSGSRTFLIATGLLVISLAFLYARRVFVGAVLSLAALVCVVTLLDASTPALTVLSNSTAVPEGIKRGISSISLLRLGETFFSRLVFLDVTLEMWRRNPWYGVGADAYRSYVVPVGSQVGTLKHWSDNANNFYLGLLAELGVIGILAFLVSIVSRRWSDSPNRALLALSVLTIGVLLIVGPHVDFPEVLILVAFLIGISTSARLRGRISHGYLVAILLLAGIIGAGRREHGVYPWREVSGGFERWLTPDATVEVVCDPVSGATVLGLQPQYVPSRDGLLISIRTGDGIVKNLECRGQGPISVPLACPAGYSTTRARIVTSPAWSPARAWPGQSRDRRLLGVKQQVFGLQR
jgi:uncharacterized membrane protein YhaH (DUF805 family)